jgi:hypothetical protein
VSEPKAEGELRRVLAALDEGAKLHNGASPARCEDAARLIRALAEDFDKYAIQGHMAGIAAARARWRLDP